MLRLILFVIVAYIVWKVASAVVRVLIGPPQSRAPRQKGPAASPPQEKPPFRDIKDAEFEDLTPPRSSP